MRLAIWEFFLLPPPIPLGTLRKFVSWNWFKTKIKTKLNLIYDWKCKIYTKWWKIKMKTHNLTQISLQNDPINRRMHGFSFCIFVDKIEVQDMISPLSLSLDQIPISSAPRMRKSIKNAMKSNGTRIGVWIIRISRRFKGAFFRREEHVFKEVISGATVWQRGVTWWTVAITRLLIETVWLSHIRPINDEGPRWVHVNTWRDALFDLMRQILIGRSWFNKRSIGCVECGPL